MEIQPPPAGRAVKPLPLPTEPVIVVHGTFANPPRSSDSLPHWWQPGGSFCQALDAELAKLGSGARCWWRCEPRIFSWTGENREVARRVAARELTAYLSLLEANPQIPRYHLVAHSHGGNVVRYALKGAGRPWSKLGGVVYLGTPFLHFGSEPDSPHPAARINWFYLVLALAVGGAAWWFQSWFWVVSAGALLKPIFDFYRESGRLQAFVPGGVLLRFPNDEAIQLLVHASPLLTDAAARRAIVDRMTAPGESPRDYSAEGYIPWIARQALDGWNRHPNQSLNWWETLIFVPALLFWLATWLWTPFAWIAAWIRTWAIRVALNRGLKAAASLVYGIDVRGLGFLPGRTGRAPYGIHDYPIPAEACQLVEADLASRDPAMLHELRAALRLPSLERIARSIEEVFTRIDLLHAQYYAHRGMIDACARALLADPARIDSANLFLLDSTAWQEPSSSSLAPAPR